MTSDLIPISASRLSVLRKCSYLYFTSYILKLPRSSNYGSKRGQIVHAVFECLLNPRHKKWYDKILAEKSVRHSPVINRFIRKIAKRENLNKRNDDKGQNNYDMIEQMILTGLKFDFFCAEGSLEAAETAFDYVNPQKTYRILGFIDKIAKLADNRLGIWDYKTSVSKFSGDDLEDNVQAKMYSLYAWRVRGMSSFVQFVFLRFPKKPFMKMEFNEKELLEFEKMLERVSQEIQEFNLEKAYSNFAADKGFSGGFKGLMICGVKTLYPGQKKADGTPMWSCEQKFPYNYFALCDENDVQMKTAMRREELTADESKGEYIIQKLFKGCPRFRNLEYSKKFLKQNT